MSVSATVSYRLVSVAETKMNFFGGRGNILQWISDKGDDWSWYNDTTHVFVKCVWGEQVVSLNCLVWGFLLELGAPSRESDVARIQEIEAYHVWWAVVRQRILCFGKQIQWSVRASSLPVVTPVDESRQVKMTCLQTVLLIKSIDPRGILADRLPWQSHQCSRCISRWSVEPILIM